MLDETVSSEELDQARQEGVPVQVRRNIQGFGTGVWFTEVGIVARCDDPSYTLHPEQVSRLMRAYPSFAAEVDEDSGLQCKISPSTLRVKS